MKKGSLNFFESIQKDLFINTIEKDIVLFFSESKSNFIIFTKMFFEGLSYNLNFAGSFFQRFFYFFNYYLQNIEFKNFVFKNETIAEFNKVDNFFLGYFQKPFYLFNFSNYSAVGFLLRSFSEFFYFKFMKVMAVFNEKLYNS